MAIIEGRRLSMFSMAINGLRLQFWGEHAGSVPRDIFIEHQTVGIAHTDHAAIICDSVSDTVASFLLPALGQQVKEISITNRKLAVVFAQDMALRVEPDERYESWQINSDDGLLIVCVPGGGLAIWYPPARA